MYFERKFELLLITIFFFFSWWLMQKSFKYDQINHQMVIARHQLGDFGLHLSLIRSFSLGNNFTPQLPFYPGKPLTYHYYLDLLVGLMERAGIRIDIALNGVSAIAFTLLLFFIYKLPQLIFRKSIFIGTTSVLLFLLNSNATFLDFIRNKHLSLKLLNEIWRIPDYIHKGPFDGSIVSIFFTLNVFLNQRHLIVALAVSLGVFFFLLQGFFEMVKRTRKQLLICGIVLGISSGIHTLIFLSSLMILCLLFFVFNQKKLYVSVLFPALILSFPRIIMLLQQRSEMSSHSIFHPGFLSPQPLFPLNFFQYWALNLGLAIVIIPLGVLFASKRQKFIFAVFFLLFIVSNIFQLSFRIDHNHSLINYFLIITNFYIAFVLFLLWRKSIMFKLITLVLLSILTISGLLNLMAIKNDFHYEVQDVTKSPFMKWIRDSTPPDSIFLAYQQILDPVTLSGRRNFYGATYYLSVMGHDYSERRSLTKKYFEANSTDVLGEMKKKGIDYVVVPVNPPADFVYSYQVNNDYFKHNLKSVYSDSDVIVYKL